MARQTVIDRELTGDETLGAAIKFQYRAPHGVAALMMDTTYRIARGIDASGARVRTFRTTRHRFARGTGSFGPHGSSCGWIGGFLSRRRTFSTRKWRRTTDGRKARGGSE